jgi:hypothetical protein
MPTSRCGVLSAACTAWSGRAVGRFTDSGAIEDGIKAIVVQRAKQSGMHWTVDGAADIISRRCQHASGRWDELWSSGTPAPTQCAQPSDRRQDSTQRHRSRAKSSPTKLSCTHTGTGDQCLSYPLLIVHDGGSR